MNSQTFTLPLSIVSPVDLNRSIREIKALNDYLVAAKVRSPGTPMSLPRLSRLLEDLSTANNLNLLEEANRQILQNELKALKKTAPIVHITFAADPPTSFLSSVLAWFRREVSGVLLLQVGLQPTLAVGCTLRTANRYFDFSLRQSLNADRHTLIESLRADR